MQTIIFKVFYESDIWELFIHQDNICLIEAYRNISWIAKEI